MEMQVGDLVKVIVLVEDERGNIRNGSIGIVTGVENDLSNRWVTVNVSGRENTVFEEDLEILSNSGR
jgi:ATP-dependent exoDNAse (exonuclease V) alpha subunit